MKFKLLVGVCSVFLLFSGALFAEDMDWNEYDLIWHTRNPESRLDVLKRAVSHYQNANNFYIDEKIKIAKQYAMDATKVVPEFAEAYYLLANIFLLEGKDKKAAFYRNRADSYAPDLSPLKELEYLSFHIDRLKANYRPDDLFSRVWFFFYFGLGFFLILFTLFWLGLANGIAMFFLRMFKVKRVDDDVNDSEIILNKFHEEKETNPSIFLIILKFLACLVPFLAVFYFCQFFSLSKAWVVFLCTLVFGGLGAFVVSAFLFSDDEY